MNFRSLIIAGLGSIGSSLISLGGKELDFFDDVTVTDSNPLCVSHFAALGYGCMTGNIEDPFFINELLQNSPKPTLFINLCAGVNNVRIRRLVAEFDVAYLDSCASMTDVPDEYRFSKLMPHTLTPIDSKYPQWVCWGINPGLVEIVTRKLIRNFGDADGCYDVTVYEYDQFHDHNWNSTAAVGWCPSALVEEVMLSPTLRIIDGDPVEEEEEGAKKTTAVWEGRPVQSRLVAHEDIWNLGIINSVQSARFIYALHPDVMEILEGDPERAASSLYVPAPEVPVFGLERIAVSVKNLFTDEVRSLLWMIDHHASWRQFGVNAVQFQTCKSLLLAIRLLQTTNYGTIPGTFCAAELPIKENEWDLIHRQMDAIGIYWQNADFLDLHLH